MCGLVGVISRDARERDHIARAAAIITHRGPDDGGDQRFESGDYAGAIASRRLSILDLSDAGHMPMSSPDGRTWIAYNGEVYNFAEIRRRLMDEGETFHSTGDTEVVLRAYQRYGPEFVTLLNGIFAIAIWDDAQQRLVLVRDRFGIKPMYVHEKNSAIHFASEIKALLEFPSVSREPDFAAIDGAVTFMGVPGERTGFAGIRKLLPSHFLVWQNGTSTVTRYADVEYSETETATSFSDAAIQLRDVMQRAVQRQMISDTPVGAFLSGGLDSSLVVAFMAGATSRPVTTYTIVYRDEDQRWERGGSEAWYARLVADRFGTDHHEVVVEPKVIDLLPKIAYHLDEPVGDPAAVSTYLISEAAGRDVKVLLAGQGADEIFAGYHYYAAQRYSSLYARVPRPLGSMFGRALSRSIDGFSRVAPATVAGRALAAGRFADLVTRNAYLAPGARHVAYHSYVGAEMKQGLYTHEFLASMNGSRPADSYLQHYDRAGDAEVLNRLLYMDLRTHLPDLILNYTDKLGMAASKELRVPFLDHEVVSFAARLPSRWKLHGSTGKHILREAMRDVLPSEILKRRKAPFGVPVRAWLRKDLLPMVNELLSEESVKRRGLFHYPAVREIIDRSRRSLGVSAHQTWTLLTLEIWFRTFIDRTMSP